MLCVVGFFGTDDGIRGRANSYPMTCEVATALGRAVTHSPQTKGDKLNTRYCCW